MSSIKNTSKILNRYLDVLAINGFYILYSLRLLTILQQNKIRTKQYVKKILRLHVYSRKTVFFL